MPRAACDEPGPGSGDEDGGAAFQARPRPAFDRFAAAGAFLAALGAFRLVFEAAHLGFDPVSLVLWGGLGAAGVGVAMRRHWARLLAIVSCCVLAPAQAMVLAGRGVVPWRAAHWADRACAAGAVVACVACVLVLTLGRADARFVGDRRRARRVIAGVLLALLALALLAMLTVEDEGPG